ncbi:hypothetical protein SDC9_81174 [bioreactor metagenome]|uniref:Uncharacterized protein n=1 Tax=bioreactor metagenome TaxID=1076179 RepID=A0A644Z2T5_9ZZZZ
MEPGDIFQHHDGVVDQHSDAEGKAAEGHYVERIAAEIDQHEGGDHRERNADRDDQCAAQIAEEEKEHQHRQQAAVERGVGDVFDRLLNVFGAVHQRRDPELARHFRVDLVEFAHHAFGHRNGIGAGLFVNGDEDSRFAVDPDMAGQRFVGVGHLRDILEVNQRTVGGAGDGEVADFIQRGEGARRPQPDFKPRFLEIAGRSGDVGGFELGDQFVQGNIEQLGFVHVEQNLDFPGFAAGDRG